MSLPSIVKSARLAALLGTNRTTLWRWLQDDAALRGCIVRSTKRSTWWSVERLQARGFLPREHQQAEPLPMRVAL